MFINLLEGLHPREAEVLCLVKDGRLSEQYKITLDIVKEAYPDIQWGGRS
jgi:DNA-binding CsgD family transcriptional regulator